MISNKKAKKTVSQKSKMQGGAWEALLVMLLLGEEVWDVSCHVKDVDCGFIHSMVQVFLKSIETQGYTDLVDRIDGRLEPSDRIMLQVEEALQISSDEIFNEKLARRLAERDYMQALVEGKIEEPLDFDVREKEIEIFEEFWLSELDQYGLARVGLLDLGKNLDTVKSVRRIAN